MIWVNQSACFRIFFFLLFSNFAKAAGIRKEGSKEQGSKQAQARGLLQRKKEKTITSNHRKMDAESDNESDGSAASSILPPLESISPSPSSDNEEDNMDENIVEVDAESEGDDEGDSSNKVDTKEEKEEEKEKNNKSKKDNSPPTEFICPISLDIMEDPVVASDGFSYERSAIAEQIRRAGYGQAARSPMTQQPLSISLVTNQVLKNQIVEWKDRHGIVTESTPAPPGNDCSNISTH